MTTAVIDTEAAAAPPSQRARLSTIVVAHGVADFYQAAIPALVPFFIARHGLSFERGAQVVFTLTILSSVLQPLFGWLADAKAHRWVATAGLLLTAAGMSLALTVPTYELTLLSVLVVGLGVAAFHPEATRAIHGLSDARRATSMSHFSLGGNVGFAVAPMIVAPLAVRHLSWVAWLGVLVIPVAIAMQRAVGTEPDAALVRRHVQSDARNDWRAFTLLGLTVSMRSVLALGLITFLPLWWKSAHAESPTVAARVTSFMLVLGLIGTIAGGRLGDRYGVRRLIAVSFALLGPALLLLRAVASTPVALLVLAIVGIVLYAPMASLVVLGQSYLPTRVGTASGVTTGLAVTIGGLAAPLLGRLADTRGLPAVLLVLALLAPVASALAYWMPTPGTPGRRTTAPHHRTAT